MMSKYLQSITSVLKLATVSCLPLVSVLAQESVRVWEEPLVIPTYQVLAPEPNPLFYAGRAYQGAKGPIYPYPLIDRLTDIKEGKTYKAVYLENEYVKICVLPEVGGRIFSAVDKTNNYDFIYHQHVIKPALIGMLGAWISGGVEWNVPHHHRASTFMTVDYTMTGNPDGSKTIWVGEIELRHRMKWIVGLTLHPGKSFIEVTGKVFNRTPYAHSMLFFANIGVHANDSYQVVFPPGTQYATYHGKNQFIRWPIGDRSFSGIDYNGVDMSWWKNHPSPISFFAWNYEDDFFGGYDHGKQAGIMLVADHHAVPGKKFFEWGRGSQGEMWDKILTDTDGPYLELMMGAYSDNQPDYSWCQPYEVKTFSMYWYPIRQIGTVKHANQHAALNLQVISRERVRLGINTTSRYEAAKVRLTEDGKSIHTQTVTIDPAHPFATEVALRRSIKEENLALSVTSSDGKELISYRLLKKEPGPEPEPVKPPPAPQEIKTVEELCLTGLRLEQFYNPALEPYPYYEEALRRDPGNVGANTALGILYCKRGMFQEAEEKLSRAIERSSRNFTSPKDGEAYYYLSVALRAQGKLGSAVDALQKAAWSSAWQSASCLALAELECTREDYANALQLVERSLTTNALSASSLDLKAVLLKKLGRHEEAESAANVALAMDPLDFWAANELYLAQSNLGRTAEAAKELTTLNTTMRSAAHSYLELAADYANCGMWDESIDVLSRLANPASGKPTSFPLVYYHIGYYWAMKGDAEQAQKNYKIASAMPPDYCFPFQMESVEILRHASAMSPYDARAPYYLGNLLYDYQPEQAIKEWERSRGLDSTFSIVHRNLGLAYARVENDVQKAVASLERAVACNPKDPRLYLELDQLYEAAGAPAEKRLALLERNQECVLRYDDALAREIGLYVVVGQYDRAIELLGGHHFHIWEGGGAIHDVYVTAHLLRGEERFKAGEFRDALRDYAAALEYPENLEVGKPFRGGRFSQIYYFIGKAHEALGNRDRAMEYFRQSVEEKHGWSEISFDQGLAFRKLGREADAKQLFDGLIKHGKEMLAASSGLDYFAKFGERQSQSLRLAHAHYLVGLGHLGNGNTADAKQEFENTLRINRNHIGARAQVRKLER